MNNVKKIYLYENSTQYNNSTPALELEIQSIELFDNRVEVIDFDGYRHSLFGFLAITYENKEIYSYNEPKDVYIYDNFKSYNSSAPNVILNNIKTYEFKDKFTILRNEYIHIINNSKLFSIVL